MDTITQAETKNGNEGDYTRGFGASSPPLGNDFEFWVSGCKRSHFAGAFVVLSLTGLTQFDCGVRKALLWLSPLRLTDSCLAAVPESTAICGKKHRKKKNSKV